MFKIVGKFLAKRLLPLIAANIDLDIDTIVKADGTYLRVRVEVFGFVLADRIFKTSDDVPTENPIDIFIPNNTRQLPADFGSVLNAQILKDLKVNNL